MSLFTINVNLTPRTSSSERPAGVCQGTGGWLSDGSRPPREPPAPSWFAMLETPTQARGHSGRWNRVTRWVSCSGSSWELVAQAPSHLSLRFALTGCEVCWVLLQAAVHPSFWAFDDDTGLSTCHELSQLLSLPLQILPVHVRSCSIARIQAVTISS